MLPQNVVTEGVHKKPKGTRSLPRRHRAASRHFPTLGQVQPGSRSATVNNKYCYYWAILNLRLTVDRSLPFQPRVSQRAWLKRLFLFSGKLWRFRFRRIEELRVDLSWGTVYYFQIEWDSPEQSDEYQLLEKSYIHFYSRREMLSVDTAVVNLG